MKIGIVSPCYNEESFLLSFFESVKEQDAFVNKEFYVEVILVDGHSDDASLDIINKLKSKYDFLKLLQNEKRYVSDGLNIAIEYLEQNNFDFMIRMDIHAVYPSGYITSLVSSYIQLEKKGISVGNVGVAIETIAPDTALKSIIISNALSSKFGVGGSDFRVERSLDSLREVDTVPFGCFRVNVFKKVGNFDTNFIRNQDDEFNHRLNTNGFKVFLVPKMSAKYYSRTTLSSVSSMFYQYGLFKPLVNKKLGSSASYRQYAPAVFLLAIVFSLALACIGLSHIFFILLLSYFIMTVMFVVDTGLYKLNFLKVFCLSISTLLLIHLSYGFGYIKGYIRSSFGKRLQKVKSSR